MFSKIRLICLPSLLVLAGLGLVLGLTGPEGTGSLVHIKAGSARSVFNRAGHQGIDIGASGQGATGQVEPDALQAEDDDSLVREVTFYQEDVEIEGEFHPNSGWGLLDLHFEGSPHLLYVNLSIASSSPQIRPRPEDVRWVIQNMPLASASGKHVLQEMTYAINLGVPDGVGVASLDYGIAITRAVLSTPPPLTLNSPLLPFEVAYQSGEIGTILSYTPPLGLLVGGQAADGKRHALEPAKDQALPNQEQGADDCVPVAVSNSLQFLNAKYKLGLPDDQVSIATMKAATGWESGGTRPGWWNKKDRYMKDKKYPIATTTTDKLADIIDAIDKNKDVELRVPGHVMFVVAITDLGNGDFSIEVNDDPDTKAKGGTKPKTLKYNHNTGNLEGTEWSAPFKDVGNIIIESPTKK